MPSNTATYSTAHPDVPYLHSRRTDGECNTSFDAGLSAPIASLPAWLSPNTSYLRRSKPAWRTGRRSPMRSRATSTTATPVADVCFISSTDLPASYQAYLSGTATIKSLNVYGGPTAVADSVAAAAMAAI